ncbi:MAG TPA: flavin reductase family protein [Pusillimonas sp.]|uniref:flavin reductase family protein n=1 Tax=Pusillimonas sp. TaxID=3040095 RepID=UPI002BD96EC9|nr:flavin reductase family protein [Pusillimonas sp.]HUH86521.1 flavin reductase family protein [Pusillimonas sp.]
MSRPVDSEPRFTARQFRDAMGQFATGVVVITAEAAGDVHAMTANAFMSGSLEPPLVLVSVARTARMHEKIQETGFFGVSVLARHQQHTSNHFAGRPMVEGKPQFEQLDGVQVVVDAVMQLCAELRHCYPCGDHTLFVGEVIDLRLTQDPPEPLLFHSGRYGCLSHLE